MIQIKAKRPELPFRTWVIHRTYELYFHHSDGRREFQPLTHRGERADLMAEVQALLDSGPAHSVDVHAGGAPLFTVLRR